MAEMTHERCSEMLRAYVAGELPRDEAGAVRSHLDECADCRAEERAAAALTTSAPEPLTELERTRLHRSLTQELFPGRANDDLATTGGGVGWGAGWKRWIVPALGSAAAVLAAVLVITGGLLGSGDDEASLGLNSGGDDKSREAAQDAPEASSGGGGGSAEGGQPAKGRALSAPAGEPETTFDSAAPGPRFDVHAGELTPEDLSEIGRSSDLFRGFSANYAVVDVEGLRRPFLLRLARSSDDAAGQVKRCAATLPHDEPILPAYGATGTYEERDALVLGFVTADAGSTSLDRYLMWVWAKGECRTPIDTLFERIDD